jgi:hypothetical protein
VFFRRFHLPLQDPAAEGQDLPHQLAVTAHLFTAAAIHGVLRLELWTPDGSSSAAASDFCHTAAAIHSTVPTKPSARG